MNLLRFDSDTLILAYAGKPAITPKVKEVTFGSQLTGVSLNIDNYDIHWNYNV